jgi:hypothetical protein
MADADDDAQIEALIERSSLGTPAARRLRESIPPAEGKRIADAATSLAVTPDGHPYVNPGFDHEAHNRWVLNGNCSVVSWTKSWCDRTANHPGRHWSPLLVPPVNAADSPHVRYEEWDR